LIFDKDEESGKDKDDERDNSNKQNLLILIIWKITMMDNTDWENFLHDERDAPSP